MIGEVKLTNPRIRCALCHCIPEAVPALSPPENIARHQNSLISEAFTERSYHPSVALRVLLDCIKLSSFITDQVSEPCITDKYSISVLAQIIDLPQCPPIDFGTPKGSLYTMFIDKQSYRCLMCGSSKTSVARALGCVRSHLGHRPFRCSGCQSCNLHDGYVLETSFLLYFTKWVLDMREDFLRTQC